MTAADDDILMLRNLDTLVHETSNRIHELRRSMARLEAQVTAGPDAARNIVERIMAMHWDMVACRCWVCEDGRAAGIRATTETLELLRTDPRERVQIGWPKEFPL